MKRWLIIALCWAAAAQAHEVHHRVEATGAIVITLTYANGQPFAYEKYALTPAGQETPQQVGNTDAQGRIAFVPGAVEKWRVQATSADGHGINLDFTAPQTQPGTAAATTDLATPRWLLAVLGLSLIFGIFGLIQLLTRKKP